MSDSTGGGPAGWELCHSVRLASATALFMGLSGPPGDVCNVDVEVTVDDGSRWSATLLTLDEVERLMTRWSETGEALGGRICYGDDLVLLRRGGLAFIVDVLDALVESGDYRDVLKRLDEA